MIGFLHPWVLFGLPLVAVPLLLHLIARREPPTVLFPAVRYLVQVTRDHHRRLRLRHLLLLVVRTLLVLFLLLAAAGPTAAIRQAAGGAHAPSALALVLDNSASSGAVRGGASRLATLRQTARAILQQAAPGDGLWLVTADGLPQRGSRDQLLAIVERLEVSPRRLDLGRALTEAAEALATDQRPGGLVLLSDLQATAVTPADLKLPLLVIRPGEPPPDNSGVTGLIPGPLPWTPEGGAVRVSVTAPRGRSVPVTVQLADRPPRQALVAAGAVGVFDLPGTAPGWWPLRATTDADEFRLDDERRGVVRLAPLARVAWSPADRYVAAAAEVLESGDRLRRGGLVTLGALGAAASVVWPPADPAGLGALNRALERRGVPWQYGQLVLTPAQTDSNEVVGREQVARRYRLGYTRGTTPSGVVATVAGEPWLVRAGDVVLLGSRLEPDWTALPLSAGFPGLVDALVNRLARGEVSLLEASPGDPVLLPDQVDAVVATDGRWPMEGGAAFRPPATGIYYLLAARDTMGALAVNVDARESSLAPASESTITSLWPTARLVNREAAAGLAFAALGQASLQGPLVWLALLLGAMEVVLASGGGRRT